MLEYMPKSNIIGVMNKSKLTAKKLIEEYNRILNVSWTPPDRVIDRMSDLLAFVPTGAVCSSSERRSRLIQIVKSKFRLNRKPVQEFFNRAARFGIYFDPIDKDQIRRFFDLSDCNFFKKWLLEKDLSSTLSSMYKPVSESSVLSHFSSQLVEATINRSDARFGVQDERRASMLEAHFGSWLFQIVDGTHVLAYNTGYQHKFTYSSYRSYLDDIYPEGLSRDCGLYVIHVDAKNISKGSFEKFRSLLLAEIHIAFEKLSNYSYIAVIFAFPESLSEHGSLWSLIHEATIFGERLKDEKLEAKFYRPNEIAATTTEYIPNLNSEAAQFDHYQSGFLFRDCIVIGREMVGREIPQTDLRSVVLLMEKNIADETPVPCPACWSLDVRGNSYPVIGVKSWECKNWLCPEKSAFNRGNRFSLVGILRDEATRDRNTYIPEDHLEKWKLDVVGDKSLTETLQMLVLHYSFPGDGVIIVNAQFPADLSASRYITEKCFHLESNEVLPHASIKQYEESPFFNRYLKVPSHGLRNSAREHPIDMPWLTVYHGDCVAALDHIQEESFDGAVTSPPYYNAREYANWPNLYCYLYDMKLSAEGVWRTLKPGAYYLFNIFDCFDNDKILAMSALGKRRLCLGSYIVQIFRRVGFSLEGNIVWYKGEIEGKRNYNQGNRAPYFQLPLNAWEHILVFRKDGDENSKIEFPSIIYRKPVIKWFNGENRHGHTAPFPHEIPDILCQRLENGAHILDPYGGSFTTALACESNNQRCSVIELHKEYCDLGITRIVDRARQLELF